MIRSLLCCCLLLPVVSFSSAQDSAKIRLVGKWGTCYSLDTLDGLCDKPFNSYIFNADGTCEHGEVVISGERIPVKGNWEFVDGSIRIRYLRHPNYSYPAETLSNIIFLNDRLFYIRVMDTEEVPGHWIYFSFRKTN